MSERYPNRLVFSRTTALNDNLLPFLAGLTLAGLAPMLRAEIEDAALLALSDDPVAVSSGKAIYQAVCFSCHGHRLEGGTGFDLRDGEWIHGGDPSSIFKSTAKGFPEKGMVAFEAVYDQSTLANVVAFLLSEQIGFRNLRYQVHNAPGDATNLETLIQGSPSREGRLPNGYADTGIAESDSFAMVFEGELIAPGSGDAYLLVSQVFENEISLFVDGRRAPVEAVGNRDFRFSIKNGKQDARIVYHKTDERSQARMFLVGEELHAPVSISGRKHLAATNFLIQPSEQPIVVRRKIERMPPRSIAVGNPVGLHYAYSPVTNSIVGLWDGGFLNIGPNIAGRGKESSRILGEWILQESPGIQLLVDSEPFSGAFQKYVVGDLPRFEYADGKRRISIASRSQESQSLELLYELEGFGRKRIALTIPRGIEAKSEHGAVLLGRLVVDRRHRSQFRVTLSRRED